MTAAVGSAILWGLATWFGWVNSVAFVAHMSMLALVAAFISAWRSDVPIDGDADS